MGYTIHADGDLMFSTTAEEVAHIALNPKLTLDINKAGSLNFVLPPGNVKNGKLQKLKTFVTVEQDGEQLFRGRVLETEKDSFNQQTAYCEGQKSFLLDSQIAPYSHSGTVHGLFGKLIANHNAKVEAEKQFVVGTVDAVSASETVTVENKYYTDTNSEIESRLLGAYGGYLRDRTVGNTHYLDWVKEYGGENPQEIKFAVNMLDLKDKISAEDVFTVLYPLGAVQINADGEYTDPLTVASVNGGQNYIQDDAAVALYGRIERSYTWNHIESAAELMQKGREHLKTGVALQTLTLKAIDMHFVDGDISRIKVGDKVHIVSDPNGVDLWMVCSRIVIDLLNPENTEYTFGEKPRMLTDNVVDTREAVDYVTGGYGGGGYGGGKQDLAAKLRWAAISLNQAQADIRLQAWDINELTGKQSAVEVRLNGIDGEIGLKATKETVDALTGRVTETESQLTVRAGQIESLVREGGVVSYINQTPESIKISAKHINLEGYVTISNLASNIESVLQEKAVLLTANTLNAVNADVDFLDVGSLTFASNKMYLQSVKIGSVTATSKALVNAVGDLDLSHSHAVTVSDDGTVTLGGAQATGGNFKIADTKAYKDGVSAALTQGANGVTISRGSWSGGVLRPSTSTGKSVDIQLSASKSAWSNNEQTITIMDSMGTNGAQSVSTGYTVTADASTLVSNAASGVGIKSWSGWGSSGTNTVTLTNGKTDSVARPNVYVSTGSWSSGSMTVRAQWAETGGTRHNADSVSISIPKIDGTWDKNVSYPRITITCGGKTATFSKPTG